MWYDYKDDMDWEKFVNLCVEEDKQETDRLVQNEPSPEELILINRNADDLLEDIK